LYVKVWVDHFGAVLDTLHIVEDRALPPERHAAEVR
jgi:hypothetical protein